MDDLPVALQASALLVDELPHQQAAVLRHREQELVIGRHHHLTKREVVGQ